MEDHIYGLNACRALFKKRPQDIKKIYLLKNMSENFSDLLHYARQHHLAYKLIENADLEKITGAIHHQGICLVAKTKSSQPISAVLKGPGPGVILALEAVANPHNLGGILRTAAHFGARAVVLLKDPNHPMPKLKGALARVAEGAMESVPLIEVELGELVASVEKSNWKIYATTPRGGSNLFHTSMSERCVVLFGAEGEGLKKTTLKKVNHQLQIPGTGEVESLNVGQACALVLGRWFQQWSLSGLKQ